MSLEQQIRDALARSSRDAPVEIQQLYRLGRVEDVQAELRKLYDGRVVNTVLLTKGGVQMSLWWIAGQTTKGKTPWMVSGRRGRPPKIGKGK